MRTKTAAARAFAFGVALSIVLFAAIPRSQAATYVPLNTTFTGLFYEKDGVWTQSSGFLTLTTTTKYKYSAKLQIGTARYSFSGYLDGNGSASKGIPRRYDAPLTVEFQIGPDDPDLLLGTVSDGTWTADLIADRAVFDGKYAVSPDAGRYTMVVPGNFTQDAEPGGDSYGTVTVDKAGRLRFAGNLADGTKVSQSARVSKNGQWPLYAALYKGGGSLYSWMLLNPSVDQELSGEVTWIRPEMLWTRYYPRGFAISLEAWGSRYFAPGRGEKVMNLTHGKIEFNGGTPPHSVTNRVVLDSSNRVINQSANRLSMSISKSSGLFSGKVVNPANSTWTRFQGVVLQGYNVAAGYFLGFDQSGEVWLEEEQP